MYEYKFVEINSKLRLSSYFDGYEEIIHEHASQGWRFVTAIPAKSQGLEGITLLSLVFEKIVSNKK